MTHVLRCFSGRWFAALAILGASTVLPSPAWAQAVPSASAGGNSALDASTARAELRFVADTVERVHPAMTDAAARDALEGLLASQSAALGDTPSKAEVAMAVQRLLASLADAHTTAAPQAAAARFLPLSFFAAADGIVVSPVGTGTSLPAAGRLLRLGELEPADVLARLAELVPGTPAWVRYHGMQMLNAEPVLDALGVVRDGAVEVVAQGADGRVRSARLTLEPAAALQGRGTALQPLLQRAVGLGQAWSHQGQTYRWRIDARSGTGVFWLLACVDSPEYRQAVDAFFDAVNAQGVRRVVLDLQFDTGGNSAVGDAWIRHLPARTIRTFGVLARVSPAAIAQRGAAALAAGLLPKEGGLAVMQRAGRASGVEAREPVFTGRVTVLVNGATFSSAGMVATLLSDNGLAQVAGEPMGADPGGYGDILSFRTPTLELPFTVSYKRFERPFGGRGSDLALDVPLPLTVNDVLAGRDVLAEWLDALRP